MVPHEPIPTKAVRRWIDQPVTVLISFTKARQTKGFYYQTLQNIRKAVSPLGLTVLRR